MSNNRKTIDDWAQRRIDNVLERPPAWGSPEAVEMQVLQLIQMRAIALRPTQEPQMPRRIFDAYLAFIRAQFPKQPQRPLFELIGESDDKYSTLSQMLRGFIEAIEPSMTEENPFQHSDVAIRLVFDAGQAPAMSACTGYYEEFRRAARATARAPSKQTGRAPKEIEEATDFHFTDARIRQSNGAPAEVVLMLGSTKTTQESMFESDSVRAALSGLMMMGEWAASSASIRDLPVDDTEQRTRLALQARRILPGRGIESASIGGKLMGWPKPVVFRASYEQRFISVIQASTSSTAFDATDEVRAVDLDRGIIVLGKKQRITCYVRPEMLGNIAMAGVSARVVGDFYRPLGERPFVLAKRLEWSEPVET
jgi:hypothetical protein